jgi:hypothetical protein
MKVKFRRGRKIGIVMKRRIKNVHDLCGKTSLKRSFKRQIRNSTSAK